LDCIQEGPDPRLINRKDDANPNLGNYTYALAQRASGSDEECERIEKMFAIVDEEGASSFERCHIESLRPAIKRVCDIARPGCARLLTTRAFAGNLIV